MIEANHPDDADSAESAQETHEDDASRRDFLTTASAVAMAGGLVASYGTLGVMAGWYLYPAEDDNTAWQFVGLLDEITRETSLAYESPGGARVAIARQGDGNAADDFVALSNVCPHLGCKVHWEPQNARFFCPCHNGAFDATGKATQGPPAEANQSLKTFPLRVVGNQLYILAPLTSLAQQPVEKGDSPFGNARFHRGIRHALEGQSPFSTVCQTGPASAGVQRSNAAREA
jgi:cytochrome b6-f complex iron-sulfur subunit